MSNNAYYTMMNQLIGRPNCAAFALVDGLQYERHFGKELTIESGVTAPLFNIGPDARIAFAGPWLIFLHTTETYRKELQELEGEFPSVSWLLSSWTLEKLVGHFKYFLDLQLPDGRCALFRFYDPRVLENIKLLLDERDYETFTTCAEAWFLTLNNKTSNVLGQSDYYWR
ncbi:DUF4123 domain-containing protein [Rahnella contaminans]|uniref:DUF4123 domain-containing protein n=1 Tax=Rahnella contaminans TaxID=2703882 RepID=UPI0023DA5F9B|nr:DUF4123 domain-containing protein [Rahnella contaminans]MDF1897265.1 DUF4123 domain-containing protein [Rahnella contaminans]